MINLERASGLPLMFDTRTSELILHGHMKSVAPRLLNLGSMVGEYEAPAGSGQEIISITYNDLALLRHMEIIREYGMRFDVTLLLNGIFGREFAKTKAHYHSLVPGAGISTAEIFQVFRGKVVVLLQEVENMNLPEEAFKIKRIVMVLASPGDVIVIPPNHGHVLINPSHKPVIVGGWVSEKVSLIFNSFRKKKGMAAWLVKKGLKPCLVRNPFYEERPPVIPVLPVEAPGYSIKKEIPIYKSFIDDPRNFSLITHPEEFPAFFEFDKLYRRFKIEEWEFSDFDL